MKIQIPVLMIFTFFTAIVLFAQPSGGPYGPIHQAYELPIIEGQIYYVSMDGDAKASGNIVNQATV